MAKLKKQILGKVSGKLGDIVFRNTKKTNYIAARPISFNAPIDENSINRREKFAVSVKFSSLVLSIPELRYIWSKQTPTGRTTINYLVSQNYSKVDSKGLTENTSLTPPMGFILKEERIVIDSEKIIISINPIGNRSGINPEIEKFIKAIAVISLNKTDNRNLNQYAFFALSSEQLPLNLNERLNFEIPITAQLNELINNHSERMIFVCLITLSDIGEPINYSSTIIYK